MAQSVVTDVINSVELDGDVKKLKSAKAEYLGKTVIIATGAFARPIGCKNEKEFMGKGISYCATCDATSSKIWKYTLSAAEILLWKKQCILPNLREKLQSSTDVMNFVQRSLFRKRPLE